MLKADDPQRFVRVEIIAGFDRDGIGDLVEARNSSNQVKDESIQNLLGKFQPIKDVLGSQPYRDDIAWKEYEEYEESGEPKPIDIRDIISLLVAFDVSSFNTPQAQPLIAYKDKRACLAHFKNHESAMKKLIPLLPDVLLLWDEIYEQWQDWYNKGRGDEDVAHGRFGKLTAITMDVEDDLLFKRKKVGYTIPEAYLYPILSALRAAVEIKGNTARWLAEPFQLLADSGPRLTAIVGQTIRATRSPNKVGKDPNTWSSCYLVVESVIKGSLSAKQEEKIQQLERELKALKRSKVS